MSINTKIEWTQWSWNPVRGCSRVSPGCENCYAERLARRFDQPGNWAEGLTVIRQGRPGWSGKVRLMPKILREPMAKRLPHRAFVCSGADLFHPEVPFEYIAAVFGVFAAAPHHTYQVLTKRPERKLEFFEWLERIAADHTTPLAACVHYAQKYTSHPALRRVEDFWTWPLPNVWLGVSVEDQKRADERLPILRKCPGQVRWLSCEPLLERVELDLEGIDWVVVGGESGPLARPCAMEWIESVVDQCRDAGVAVFVKQLGKVVVSEGRAARNVAEARDLVGDHVNDRWLWRAGLGDIKGGDPSEWPEKLCVRIYPGDEFPPKPVVEVNEENPF